MSDLNLVTRDALKKADPDRFRAALMAGVQEQRDLLLLYAFHYELSKVPDVTSEPMLGQIRYAWWREALDEIYTGQEVRRHEISTPLAEMLKRTEVPRFWVDRLIDGRARDLDPQPFKDIEDARNYARQTSGQLLQIAVKILGAAPDQAHLKAGEAWGLTGLTRSYSYYHDRILQNLGFETLITAADESYAAAKGKVVSSVFPALAYVALVPNFLSRMRRAGFEPKTDRVDYGPLAKQFRLFSAGLRGVI
jgi:phytoene synthase